MLPSSAYVSRFFDRFWGRFWEHFPLQSPIQNFFNGKMFATCISFSSGHNSKVPILPVSAGAQFYLICILKRISRSYVVGAGTIYSCIRIMYSRTKFSNTMVTTSRFVGLNWFHGVHSCRSWIFLSSSFYFPPLIFPPANRVLSACPRASIFFFLIFPPPKRVLSARLSTSTEIKT
jgi:hypothetical protein